MFNQISKVMKKNILIFCLLAVYAAAFVSCEDDESNATFENGSATISGIAYANIDLTNTGTGPRGALEYVPSGTTLYAKFSSKNLVLEASQAEYADLILETTVGANGEYSFTVPANEKPFSVTIYGDEFFANLTISASVTFEDRFYLSPITVTNVFNGANLVRYLIYQNEYQVIY
jgi:hypothetical protein